MQQNSATISKDIAVTLKYRLAANSDGILEQIARENGVSTFTVVEALPEEQRLIIPGSMFEMVMRDLEEWGEVLFIVHTTDIVLECVGTIPSGTLGHGYYNLHGSSPIGGHIRMENCTDIAFVMRPFMGRPSRSVQFFNADGEAMFKVFVRRNKARELLSDQVTKYDALTARVSSSA